MVPTTTGQTGSARAWSVNKVGTVLVSPVFHQESGRDIAGCQGLEPSELVSWMLEDRLQVRMQLQMHKFIWDPKARGV